MATFAAATGAAGLVSLGLQVCSGLIAYCASWKSYDEDIAALGTRIQGLSNILELLNSTLSSPGLVHSPSRQQVEVSVIACAEGIHRLARFLRKIGPQDASGASDRRSRLIYPFKRVDLLSLNSTLNDLQGNLNTAMHVYELSLRLCHSPEYIAIMQVDHMLGQMQATMEAIAVTSSTQPRSGHGAMILHPSLAESESLIAVDTKRPAMGSKRCTCHGIAQLWSLQVIERLRISTKYSAHAQSCGLFGHSNTTSHKSLFFKFPFGYNTTGAYMILKVIQAAAGPVLSRTLICQRALSNDHPAIQLLNSTKDSSLTIRDIAELRRGLLFLMAEGKLLPMDVDEHGNSLIARWLHIVDLIVVLAQGSVATLYQSSLAEARLLLNQLLDAGVPADDERGIFRVVFAPYRGRYFSWARYCHLIAPFCLDLLQRGAALEQLLSHHSARYFLSKSPFLAQGQYAYLRMRSVHSHPRAEAGISELGKAIILKSERTLQQALSLRSLGATTFHASSSIPALHLAAAWPEGVSSLINAGANVEALDEWGLSALAFAIREGSLESVRRLIAADIAISRFGRHLNICFREPAISKAFALPRDLELSLAKSVIEGVANRRKRLRRFAMDTLPVEKLHGFDTQRDQVVDTSAKYLIYQLGKAGVVVPPSLYVHSDAAPIFAYVAGFWFDIEIADLLWEKGFRDLHWQLPLATTAGHELTFALDVLFSTCWNKSLDRKYLNNQLSLAEWLIDHGVFSHRDGYDTEQRRLLDLAARLGHFLLYLLRYEIKQVDMTTQIDVFATMRPMAITFLQRLFRARLRECCQCHCSSSGCNSFSKIYRNLNLVSARATRRRIAHDVTKSLSKVLSSDMSQHARLARDLIRAVAFSDLCMTHTCWMLGQDDEKIYMDQDEIEEFHAEDSEVIARFERFVTLLVDSYETSDSTFLRWYEESYTEHIDLFDAEESRSQIDVEAMRELGVVLRPECHS